MSDPPIPSDGNPLVPKDAVEAPPEKPALASKEEPAGVPAPVADSPPGLSAGLQLGQPEAPSEPLW
ncbi:hypothetical protein [Luteolibacter soli]|uniref:hypothetical protein n=1 Tax=Luteolibacter soli TaxID=3135280 RepID=UPI0031195648